MKRVIGGALAALLMCVTASNGTADIVVSAVDFNGQTPSGLTRLDESTGIALPAGDVAALSIGGFTPLFPTDVATSPDGRLFAVDAGTGSVLHFDGATGAPLLSPLPQSPNGLFAQRQAQALGLSFTSLTFSDDGMLYVLDAFDVSGNNDTPGVRVFDPNTGAEVDTLLESSSTTIVGGSAINFDNDGDLLLSDRDSGIIYKVDVDNDTISPFITSGLPAAAFTPAGVAVADSGDIYVANLFDNNILRFDSDGTNPSLFAEIPPLPAPNPPGSNFPSDIIFNRAGDRLLVAVLGAEDPGPDGTAAGSVLSYDLSGNLVETIASGLRPTSSLTLTADLLPGDFNGDGVVDTDDYTKWKADFGTAVTPTTGADANGDGTVDLADYTVWRNSLGATGAVSGSIEGVQVPEPATCLISLGLLLLGWKQTRSTR